MKQLIVFIGAVLLTASSYAQSPDKFTYQAVVRNSVDALVTNSVAPIQISILQTSTSGTAVYVETHTPTTNENGLLTIAIGEGTVVSGAFATINWWDDAYFLQTEIDVDNNASYDVTGTSQLLSVPYALNANTLTGGIDQAYILALEARITALEPQAAVVGDYRDGGIVIWVDPADDTHGLVCALDDNGASVFFGCQGTFISGTGIAIGTGLANSNTIVAGCSVPGIAADLALNLNSGGYSDWFLPSLDELNEMYVNKAVIEAAAIANGGAGFVSGGFYRTSSENDQNTAWGQVFSTGNQVFNFNKDAGTNFYMRAIRAF